MNSDTLKSISDVAGIFQVFAVIAIMPAISSLRNIAKSIKDVEKSFNDFKVHVYENFLSKEDYVNLMNNNRNKRLK